MAALKNARHERFAQELAKGESASAAYEIAGYNPDRGAASRLSANVSVRARVAEILDKAATRAEITVASISDRLLKIAEKGEKSREAPLLSVSRAALMDVAKLNGLIVNKQEHAGANGGPIQTLDLTKVSDEDLDRLEAIFGPLAVSRGDDESPEDGEGAEAD